MQVFEEDLQAGVGCLNDQGTATFTKTSLITFEGRWKRQADQDSPLPLIKILAGIDCKSPLWGVLQSIAHCAKLRGGVWRTYAKTEHILLKWQEVASDPCISFYDIKTGLWALEAMELVNVYRAHRRPNTYFFNFQKISDWVDFYMEN